MGLSFSNVQSASEPPLTGPGSNGIVNIPGSFLGLGSCTLCIAPVVPSVGSLQKTQPRPGSDILSPPSYHSRRRQINRTYLGVAERCLGADCIMLLDSVSLSPCVRLGWLMPEILRGIFSDGDESAPRTHASAKMHFKWGDVSAPDGSFLRVIPGFLRRKKKTHFLQLGVQLSIEPTGAHLHPKSPGRTGSYGSGSSGKHCTWFGDDLNFTFCRRTELVVEIMWVLFCFYPLQMCPKQHWSPLNDECVWWYKPP